MAEIAFERLYAGIESARGVPLANPTHHMGMVGTIKPMKGVYRPANGSGNLAEYVQSAVTRKWSEWDAEGPADVYLLPLLLNVLAAGGIDGSGAVAAALTTVLTGADNDLVFTAIIAGGVGNTITVEYIDPVGNNKPLHVDVVGRAIRIWLATGVAGAIATIASAITTAIGVHPVASTLVTVANSGGDNATGVVTAMAVAPLSGGSGADVTIPAGGTLSRLWTFAPDMDADTIESLTLYWGDPAVQMFRAAFCMIDEMTVSSDASGTDGVGMSISGKGQFPTKTAPGATPAVVLGPMLLPVRMQMWVDTTSAIGTTEIVSRVISAEVTTPSGVSYKYLAAGPSSTLSHTAAGRGVRHAAAKVKLELPDLVQYDQWDGHTPLKVRIRFNGPLIEGALYHYLEYDLYGPLDTLDWGDHEGTNRTIEVALLSEYNAYAIAAGYDWCARVQNDHDAL